MDNPAEPFFEPRMPKKRAAFAVVTYPGQPMVVASVATTKDMFILALGDGREEHYTYPPDGRFHITPEDQSSGRSFFAPGPAYADLSYYRIAIVAVPTDPAELARPYRGAGQMMTIAAPVAREGVLEVGILGQKATPAVTTQLQSDGALVGLFQGPRSDTTLVFRYTP
jgi:hypothetical protein